MLGNSRTKLPTECMLGRRGEFEVVAFRNAGEMPALHLAYLYIHVGLCWHLKNSVEALKNGKNSEEWIELVAVAVPVCERRWSSSERWSEAAWMRWKETCTVSGQFLCATARMHRCQSRTCNAYLPVTTQPSSNDQHIGTALLGYRTDLIS